MYRHLFSFAAPTVCLLALATTAHAQSSISIANHSFESPDASGSPFLAIPFHDNWDETPEAPGYDPANYGGITWSEWTGVFLNPPSTEPTHITNMDGAQGGYIANIAGMGLSQTLSSTYQAGNSYRLTVGVHPGSRAPLTGDQFSIGLSYLDGGSLTPIASTPITFNGSNFPDGSLFYDFDVDLAAVQAGDAWAGKQIGIEFVALNGFNAGSWDLDNVRLTAVPEPSTITLLAAGLLGGGLFLRRKRSS